jgi:hypothetical protein
MYIYSVYLVISLPKIPYIHRIYVVLANPHCTYVVFAVPFVTLQAISYARVNRFTREDYEGCIVGFCALLLRH